MKFVFKTLSLILMLFLFGLGARYPFSVSAQESPLVLAFYYAWFDQNTWTSGQSVDLPATPYNSADRATIERHVAQAQSAGIDALVQSWYGPQIENNQTETNFRTLLDVAQAKGFKAAVDFETTGPFFGDIEAVTTALTTLLSTHAQHPAYLRYQGKPVIFFFRQERFSVDEWAAIRNQVDPNHDSYWIAEGVDIAYQAVFDGHHLYSIAWADSPAAELAKWGDRVRNYEAENQVDRLWVATAMPGYDDTRLPRDNAFSVPRRNGDYYRETWQGALASQPDMLVITSFNEWLEGTHLEPSASYGNLYLDITRELVTALRGRPPSAPPPAELQATPLEQTEGEDTLPDGPYIQASDITNVRGGPATSFEVVGRLAADSAVSVVGRTEASDWWEIDFEAGPDGKGWVSGEVVEFVGDASLVPVVDAPDTPSIEVVETDSISETTEVASEIATSTPMVRVPPGGVNIRTGPGLDFELLGRLDEGTSAPVVAKNENGDWWQIEYSSGEDGVAWVADVVIEFVGNRDSVPLAVTTEVTSASAGETSTPIAAEAVVVGSIEAVDPVNVRSEPSVDGVVLGGLFPGESADVLAISADGEWWQIDFADAPDQAVWVATEFVRFTGDKITIPIFGIGTVTPTPGPTDTPTATPTFTPTPTIPAEQPTYAPTATSVYGATSAALLAVRGTPEPPLSEPRPTPQNSSFSWSNIPWGVLSALVILGLVWYQFAHRRRR